MQGDGTKERLRAPDLARFLGISIVILQHSSFLEGELLTVLTSFHMPMFLILSGYLAARREGKECFAAWFKKRSRQLMLPYLFFSLAYVAVYLVLEFLHSRMPDPMAATALILKGTSLYGPSVCWFLTALFGAEILLKLFLQGKRLFRIVLAFLLAAGMLLALLIGERSFPDPGQAGIFAAFGVGLGVALLRLPLCVLFLCIGRLLCMLEKLLPKKRGMAGKVILAVATLVFGGATYLVSRGNGGTDLSCLSYGNSPLLMLLAAVCGSLAVFCLCRLAERLPQKLTALPARYGKNSLILLLTHLDFRILYMATLLPHPSEEAFWRCLFILFYTLLLETPLIFVIDRYFPFLCGKSRKRVQKGIDAKAV